MLNNQNPKTKSMIFRNFYVCILIILFFAISCKKNLYNEFNVETKSESNTSSVFLESSNPCELNTTCEDCYFQDQSNNDTTQSPTVLGAVYNNPYSIANMTTAYNNVNSTNISSISTTHFYVRFKPSSPYQLITLDSLDLELYDYPLNREIINEGDYWPDAYQNLQSNEQPWLYTVVENTFIFPNNIVYEVLESLHIPDDNPALEHNAYTITGHSVDCNSFSTTSNSLDDPPREREPGSCDARVCMEEDTYWDYDQCQCVPIPTCPQGYQWNGSDCIPDIMPPPSFPRPSGQINYQTYLSGPPVLPVKYTRIVARRFFKIDRTYTDQNGNFQLSKTFPKKVTIKVKFKTSTAYGKHSIREEFTNFGFWKSAFPVTKNIGTYRGNDLSNLNYVFVKGSKANQNKTRDWLASVSLNTIIETNQFLSQNSLTLLPSNVKLYLEHIAHQDQIANFDMIRRSSSPLLNLKKSTFEKWLQGIATVISFGIPPLGAHVYPQPADIRLHYLVTDMISMTASKVATSVGNQLGVIYLFNLDGDDKYFTYSESLRYVYINHSFTGYAPFGNPSDNNVSYKKEIVAIWQLFAQHIGHTIADKAYGTNSQHFELQGKNWISNTSTSSHSSYLELFDPNVIVPDDYFSWIPVGLLTDLIDNSNEQTPVLDNVAGFSYYEIQLAYYTKPTTILDFKNALKSLKPSQSVAIDQLFTSYGY